MCQGREGSSGCSVISPDVDKPWLWVVLTISLWLGLLLFIYVLRTCSNRQRRQRFARKLLTPLCRKLGVRVVWDDPATPSSPSPSPQTAGSEGVFCISSPFDPSLPPPYEVVAYINPSSDVVLPLSPPAYEEVTSQTLRDSDHEVPREATAAEPATLRVEEITPTTHL